MNDDSDSEGGFMMLALVLPVLLILGGAGWFAVLFLRAIFA